MADAVGLQDGDEELLALCAPSRDVGRAPSQIPNGLGGFSITSAAGFGSSEGASRVAATEGAQRQTHAGPGVYSSVLKDVAAITPNPFCFEMSGSVMSVTNSELQIGPKFVTGGNDSFIRLDSNTESVDVSTSQADINSALDNYVDGSIRDKHKGKNPTLHIKITPNGPVETITEGDAGVESGDVSLTHDAMPSLLGELGDCPLSSVTRTTITKTTSTPVPLRQPPVGLRSTPVNAAFESPRTPVSPASPLTQMPPQYGPLTPTFGGQSTFVNSKIHNGTQIVITYTKCGRKACTDGCMDGGSCCDGSGLTIPGGVEEGVEGGDHLQQFTDILKRRYKQRARSPLLPWHLGRTMAPLEDYYLEPRIFPVDRRGQPTTEGVCLYHVLTTDQHETRFLVEGEAGMGKTLLAAHLAHEWAVGGRLAHFGLVLLVTLSDFHGSLQSYMQHNVLPSYFDPDKFRQVWNYWKKNEKDILFILDGYDELGQYDKDKDICEVRNLIRGQDFPNSVVLVTSRPAALQCHGTRLVVKGFDEQQMWKFIEKYFDVVKDSKCGASLLDILVRHHKYRKLAERPLFCVLLCMLYETDSARQELPDRMSDMLYKIMLCLIKWKKARENDPNQELDGFPAEYEEAFHHFGRVCVDAVKNDRHRFSDEDVRPVPYFEEIRQLGFLYTEDESDIPRLQVQKFWKPVHQTFIEYLAALHIANHISNCWWGCRQCRRYSSLLERKDSEVLVFTAGVLAENAHRLFGVTRYPKLQKLPEVQLLSLLREAGPHLYNRRIIAHLLDKEYVDISTNEAHIEGWTHLLPEKFYKLRALELVWRIKSSNPDIESSFVEASPEQLSAFFAALHNNTSLQTLVIRAKQDGAEFTDVKLQTFFADLHLALTKKGLKNLEFRDMKIYLGKYLRGAFERVSTSEAGSPFGLNELRLLKLHTFLSDEDLSAICGVLGSAAPLLQTLRLEGLELGHDGFTALAKLIKMRVTLKYLYLSMNKALLVNVFGCADETLNSQAASDFSPDAMRNEYRSVRLRKHAAQRSQHEFTSHEHDHELEEDEEAVLVEERSVDGKQTDTGSVGARQHSDGVLIKGVKIGGLSPPTTPTSPSSSNVSFLPWTTGTTVSVPSELNGLMNRKPACCDEDVNSSSEDEGKVVSGRATPAPVPPNSALNNHPFTELPFLFDVESDSTPRRFPQAKHYWFIKGCESRLPLPLCVTSEHKSVFHYLFTAVPKSHLETLSLDQPGLYLTMADLVCLGDAVRKAKTLKTLDLQRLRKVKSYMPILLALGQSTSLESLTLSSSQVTVTDPALQLACVALARNKSLRHLSLANWKFQLQDRVAGLRAVSMVLSSWQVQDLNLRHCSFQLLGPADAEHNATAFHRLMFSPPIVAGVGVRGGEKITTEKELESNGPWKTVTTLNLAEAEVTDASPRRGPLILPALHNFTHVHTLDLSASLARPTLLHDPACLHTFRLLAQMALLRDLTLNYWQMNLSESEPHYSDLCNAISLCTNVRDVKLHNVNEQRPNEDYLAPCETSFIHALVSSLPSLRSLSVCLYTVNGKNMDKEMAGWLAECLYEHWGQSSMTLQVFGVSPSVCAALKAGFTQPLCVTRERRGPPRVLALAIRRPLQAPCYALRRILRRVLS